MRELKPMRTKPAPSAALPVGKRMMQKRCACGGSSESGHCEKCRKKDLQRKETSTAVSGTLPPIVDEVLSSPGRALDAQTRAFFEPRFGHDFSRVRVHTDAQAAESARAMNALGYTVQSDVVFGSQQYAPDTARGKHLLAHELAHVVQQEHASGLPGAESPHHPAESVAELASIRCLMTGSRSSALAIRDKLRGSQLMRPAVQRLSTWAGTWNTDLYDILDTAGVQDGIHIKLRFKPGDPVDSSNIAIIQMANTKDTGKVVALDPTVKSRSIPAGQRGEGAHIDHLAESRTPIYDVKDASAKDKFLTDTPAFKDWGEHGFRYTDSGGTFRKRDAWIDDTPQRPGRGPNSSQIFESTAVALSGTQTGTYYGSVRWGWTTDAGGAFHKLPLSTASADVPSGTFARAAQIWNTTKTSKGEDVLKFYTASGRFTNTDDVPLVSDPTNPAATTVDKLAKNSRIEVINKGLGSAFNKDKTKPQWWKVTVVDGPSMGKVGWVMSGSIAEGKS